MFETLKGYYNNNERFRLLTKIIFVWVISRAIMLLMVPIMNLVADEPHNILYYMNPWDAEWYKEIVESGYRFPRSTGMANWAFFPLYPLVCGFIRTITFKSINTYAIGMAVSNVCIIIAVYYAVKFAWLELDNNKYNKRTLENIIIFLMLAGPFAVYYGAMYTEAMFILCVILCFYNAKQGKWIAAGVFSAFASATRIVGCTLIVVLFTEMYIAQYNKEKKNTHKNNIKYYFYIFKNTIKNIFVDAKKLFSLAICPLGIFAYMTYLKWFCGDAWAFYHVQRAWRTQKMFPIIEVLFKSCFGQLNSMSDVKPVNGIILGWFCVFTILLYIVMIKDKHYALGIFGLISLMIPLTSSVMSTLRFIMGSFVIYIGVTRLLSMARKPLRIIIMSMLAVMEIICISAWYFWDGLLM